MIGLVIVFGAAGFQYVSSGTCKLNVTVAESWSQDEFGLSSRLGQRSAQVACACSDDDDLGTEVYSKGLKTR